MCSKTETKHEIEYSSAQILFAKLNDWNGVMGVMGEMFYVSLLEQSTNHNHSQGCHIYHAWQVHHGSRRITNKNLKISRSALII